MAATKNDLNNGMLTSVMTSAKEKFEALCVSPWEGDLTGSQGLGRAWWMERHPQVKETVMRPNEGLPEIEVLCVGFRNQVGRPEFRCFTFSTVPHCPLSLALFKDTLVNT